MLFSQLSFFVVLALCLSGSAAPVATSTIPSNSPASTDYPSYNVPTLVDVEEAHNGEAHIVIARDSLGSDCVGTHCMTIHKREPLSTPTPTLPSILEATTTQAYADNVWRRNNDACAGEHCITNIPRMKATPAANNGVGEHCSSMGAAARMLATLTAAVKVSDFDEMGRLPGKRCISTHCETLTKVPRMLATPTAIANEVMTAHTFTSPTSPVVTSSNL